MIKMLSVKKLVLLRSMKCLLRRLYWLNKRSCKKRFHIMKTNASTNGSSAAWNLFVIVITTLCKLNFYSASSDAIRMAH